MWKHTYSVTTCPECHSDLSQAHSVLVDVRGDDGTSLGQVLESLDTSGELSDDNGMIEAGKHAGTSCAACGEHLDHLETI